MDLVNRKAIVTGGGGTLGGAIACNFAKEGADVAIIDINLPAAEKKAREIEQLGRKALALPSDISKEADVKNMVKTTLETFGKIDILVNCAGISKSSDIQDLSLDDWNATISVNLTGTFLCCREVIDHMIANEYGKIINIASVSGLTGRKVGVEYSASKTGVLGITRTLALQVAKNGINVNAVAPALIVTPLHETWSQENLDKLLASCPFKRGGKPQDVADIVTFLASDKAGWITGEVVALTGGAFMG